MLRTEPNRRRPWGGLEALGRSWIAFAASITVGFPLSAAAIRSGIIRSGAAQKVFLENPGDATFDQVVASGLPQVLAYILFNGAATLITWAVVLLFFGLRNTSLAVRFPRLFEVRRRSDPSLIRLWPFRARIRADLIGFQLRTTYLAYLYPVVDGIFLGFCFAALADPPELLRSLPIDLALVFPHGAFEFSAMMLPGAFVGALAREIREDVLAGKADEVWNKARDFASLRRLGAWIGISMALVVVAAFIEAYATVPIADALSAALGRPTD